MGTGITTFRIKRIEDRVENAESSITTLETDVSTITSPSFRATLGTYFEPGSYSSEQTIDEWVQDLGNSTFFTLTSSSNLVVTEAGRYLMGYNLRIQQNTPYAETYFLSLLEQQSSLVNGTAEYTPVDGNITGRTSPVSVTTVVDASAGHVFRVRCRDGDSTADHRLAANGCTFWAVKL